MLARPRLIVARIEGLAERDRQRFEHGSQCIERKVGPLAPSHRAGAQTEGARQAGLGDDMALGRAGQLDELFSFRVAHRRVARGTIERDVARDLVRDLPVDGTFGLEQAHHLRQVQLREVEPGNAGEPERSRHGFAAGFVVLGIPRLRNVGHAVSLWTLMGYRTVAVTGIAGFLGQRLLLGLEAEADVARIVGLDVREPPRRSPHLELHRVDIAGHDLKPLLEGVDVVVHLAAVVDPIADEPLMTRVNVEGTRRVLDAAAAVGVRKIVRLSTTAVYGAWATNPLPLTEDAPLRPNPGFSPAVHAAEVERLLAEWQHEHPAVTITTLRAAPVLGAGANHLWARLLTTPTRVRVR